MAQLPDGVNAGIGVAGDSNGSEFPVATNNGTANLQRVIGQAVPLLAAVQALSGVFRGSKGGPTDRAADASLRCDHHDMAVLRLLFEKAHKSCGYLAPALMVGAIVTGLMRENAPTWRGLFLCAWWAVVLIVSAYLRRKDLAADTCQAIWGPDPEHPGNREEQKGCGTTRPEFPQGSFGKKLET